jgi:hypothetical protein
VARRKAAAPEAPAAPTEAEALSIVENDRSSRPSDLTSQGAQAPQKRSWRDLLPIHPAADLFPLMAPDELRSLGEDIARNGLQSPIKLYGAEPVLLDGRNRLDAMELVGINFQLWRNTLLWNLKPCSTEYSGDDPYGFVVSANIHRRHLTAEKKRELIAELIKADPTKSNRQIADQVKVSHPHVGKVRAELEKSGDVETVTTSTDTKGRKQPAHRHRRERQAAPNAAASMATEPKPVANDCDAQETADRRKAEAQ